MKLFVFGLGYSAGFIARHFTSHGHDVVATVRSPERFSDADRAGLSVVKFDGTSRSPEVADALRDADAVLISIPPDAGGDPVLRVHGEDIAQSATVSWIGYLSTIGVYGDRQGGWVDETDAAAPSDARSERRWAVEQAWLAFGRERRGPVQIFRLAGIYGPERNQLAQLAAGTARRIVKPGQVFNRIHVDDIVQVVVASLARPRNGAIYNVTDNEPSPPQDVISFAAELSGVPPPPEIAFDRAELTPMSRSFYSEVKRVRSDLIRSELGVSLRYPTYREGLRALRAAGEGPA